MRLYFTLLVTMTAVMLGGCVTDSPKRVPKPKSERVQAQLDLARGYLEKREFGRAKEVLAKAREIDERSVEALVLSAVLFHAEKEVELAERYYTSALRIEPANSQALNNYGSFLYAEGRYKEALKPLQRLVADTEYRARPQAFENLGLAHLKVDDDSSARAAFERAVALNFGQSRSQMELADLAFAEQDLDTAEQYLDNFRRLRPRRPSARSLCLGLKLAHARKDADKVASQTVALRNLFPDQAGSCQPNL